MLYSCSQTIDNNDINQSKTLLKERLLANEYNNAKQLYNLAEPSITPELSTRGNHTVGVKTLTIVNPNQLDPVTHPLKDRKLTVEVWYPSDSKSLKNKTKTVYKNQTKLGIPFSLKSST